MPSIRRIIVISDLHIGGEYPILRNPDLLIDFLQCLAAYKPRQNEEVELVINGDFVDFLAEDPYEAWTEKEETAVTKFNNVVRRQPELFDAFALCAKQLRRFTILLGNHDTELAYPKVRDKLFENLHTEPHRCYFIQNNECYRAGDLLIEHGNRYDPWNAIDHNGLREVVSCASRGEVPPQRLEACPGARFVCDVINPIKKSYRFVDLLKPEDKIVALLLTALEPSLMHELPMLFKGARDYIQNVYRKAVWSLAGIGLKSGRRRLVNTAEQEDTLPASIKAAFEEDLKAVEAAMSRKQVARKEAAWHPFWKPDRDSLKTLLENGEPVDQARLRKLQVSLESKLANDRTFDLADTESSGSKPYVDAAREMINAGAAKVVIMGHTHLRRNIPSLSGGRYLNTGTWARLIRIESEYLTDSDAARDSFVGWLHKLVENELDAISESVPTYADVCVIDGAVVEDNRPLLRTHHKGGTLE